MVIRTIVELTAAELQLIRQTIIRIYDEQSDDEYWSREASTVGDVSAEVSRAIQLGVSIQLTDELVDWILDTLIIDDDWTDLHMSTFRNVYSARAEQSIA